MKFTITLLKESDGGYAVTVPALPGCVTQGDTREEALANAREAIEVYLEDCKEAGELLPVDTEREYIEIDVHS